MNELLVTVIIQYNKNNVKKLVNKVNMIWIAYETDKTTSRCEVCPQDIKQGDIHQFASGYEISLIPLQLNSTTCFLSSLCTSWVFCIISATSFSADFPS